MYLNATVKGSFTMNTTFFSVKEIVYHNSTYTQCTVGIASLTYKRNPRETNASHIIIVTWLPSIQVTSILYK